MKNRNHKITIVKEFLENVKNILLLVLLFFTKIPINPFIFITGVVVLILGLSIVSWYNTYYEIDEYEIKYTKGFFNKNITLIPVSKISTIDISQNVFYQFLNVARLKLDSGAGNSGESEISLVVSMQRANEIKNILGKSKDESKKENYIKSSTKETMIYAITRNTTTIIMGTIFAINGFLDDLLNWFNIDNSFYDKIGTKISQNAKIGTKISQIADIKNFILIVVIIIIIGYIISKLISVFYYTLKFSNFTIYKDDNCINIKYGEISKKKYSLPINKINAVILKQNLMRQLLGLYSLEISTVGYGNEDKEEAILYPICSIDKAKEIIEKLVPDYNMDLELKIVNSKGRKRFFMFPMIITFIFIITLSIIFTYGYISIILALIVALFCYLEYKNTSIGYCEEKVMLTRGTFNKKIIIIKMDKVEDITVASSFFQRKDNLCTYQIDYYGKSLIEVLTLRHLPKDHFENLKSELIK